MKYSFFFILLIVATIAHAQDSTESFTIKKGVYTTFRDIRNNNPLPDTRVVIKERAGLRTGGGPYKIESSSLSNHDLSELKKIFVGYSDGKDFYISDRFTTGGLRGLSKCFLKGPYILAQVEMSGPSTSGMGMSSASYEYVININKGLSLKLTKKVLEDILKQYPTIEEEYKDEKHILRIDKVILQKVNKQEALQSAKKE